MLLITNQQLEQELSKLTDNKDERAPTKVIDIKHGRGNIHAVPDSLRQIIAEEAINGTPAKDISESFGVSESSISAYKHGATSTSSYNEPNESLIKKNDAIREDISDKARARLMQALEEITPDKMSGAKLRDVASVAKDMSTIVKNMEPTGPLVQNNTQVVVYRPRARDEDEYETITVNE